MSGDRDPREAARHAWAAASTSVRPEAWISRREMADLEADAAAVAARRERGEDVPLAGVTLAVKDNIDVAGLDTTCAHPGYARRPARSATVVSRLTDAGTLVVGKTNLDQFATGLVGTRSPYGAVRNAVLADRVSGGSSSGSAVAVALGEVDAALGTDTAGSGRVPAALNGVVGLKPTRGLLSTAGVVPACRSLDCVSVLARSVDDAVRVLTVAAGPDLLDPWSRTPPLGARTAGDGPLRIGIPRTEQLTDLDASARRAWLSALGALGACGTNEEVDLTPYLEAGELLYGSALIAERWDAVGAFLEAHPEGADPSVATLIGAARDLPAHQYAGDLDRIHRHAAALAPMWRDVDVVALPTVGEAPTLAAVAADPLGVNARLGRLTTGCNVLDLCAAAVPCGVRDDGIPFGVTILGPAFADAVVATAAARLTGEADPPVPYWAAEVGVVVVGAHLRGQPLNGELTDRGARFAGAVRTAPTYRLHALPTEPPKPGLVRVTHGGASVGAELWIMPLDGFGDLVRGVRAPLAIGTVELDDGTAHHGFLCEAAGAAGAPDITTHGSWPAYLASIGASADGGRADVPGPAVAGR